MDLHGIASQYVSAVNPTMLGTLQVSVGASPTDRAGRKNPLYAAPIKVWMQVQALTQSDILKTNAMNVSECTHSIYLEGRVDALLRVQNKGGDLITMSEGEFAGQTFLVKGVLEHWPDWTKVAAVMQNGS